VSSPSEEPAWKQRAVERSIKTAKLRAAQRVQRFLDAAQAIITEKGSTDFTVQEVVDRSRQSLRSFYLQFDGKHELLPRPDPTAKRPLFTDFAPQLLISHPTEVRVAHAPLIALFTELMEAAHAAGRLGSSVNPKRMAAMTMQTVMFTAQSSTPADDSAVHPITADEVWSFCAHGFAAS
jgi:AcrR family transcriptional regulator